MLAAMWPVATAANRPCIMFDSALIGPHEVSPRTRRPTSISGNDSRIATIVIHTGISNIAYCTTHRSTVHTPTPIATHDSGKSAPLIFMVFRLVKVSISKRHLSARAVRPPATSMPVAGHITQNSTSVRDDLAVKILWPAPSTPWVTRK